MPHTMEKNVEEAMKLYSGDKPIGLFADHLPTNIEHMNLVFKDILSLFKNENVGDLGKLPDSKEARGKFAKLFREFSTYLQASQIQGFAWDKVIDSVDVDTDEVTILEVLPTEDEYNILLQRYKELKNPSDDDAEGGEDGGDITFDIDPYLTEQNTGVIDYAYMNSRFEKWLKQLSQTGVSEEELNATLEELHKSFAFLSQEDQKFANIFLHDVQTGDVQLQDGMTMQDYIFMYANNAKKEQVARLVKYLGVNQLLIYNLLDADVNEKNLNEYGRFDALKASVVKEKAQKYFTALEGKALPMFRVNNKVSEFLAEFILAGGIDVPDVDDWEE